MGIEYFFNSIKTNKDTNLNETAIGILNSINVNYLYIDFNSIIYQAINSVEYDLNKLLVKIIYGTCDDEKSLEKLLVLHNINLENFTLEVYQSYFNYEKLLQIILDKIVNIIYTVISKSSGIPLEYFYDDSISFNISDIKLEKIMISIDGIPTMSKIVEQKKRKHMNYIINELKKYIQDIYVSNKIISDNRILFEKYKKTSSEITDSIWNNIFFEIENKIISENFTNFIKNKIPSLKEYIVSSSKIPGEGEKKIMEDIIEHNKSGSYSVFSPDADVIVLMLITQSILSVNNKSTNFNVIRLAYDSKFPHQQNIYNYVNIPILSKNIVNYVLSTVEEKNKSILINIKKDNIIMDIATLITMFGNDFIPKIESINPVNNITSIMKVYCNSIILKPFYIKDVHIVRRIIINNEVKYEINCNNFVDFMYKLSQLEADLLRETYMSTTYKNYKFLKIIFLNAGFNELLLHELLLKYVKFANKIIENLEITSEEDYKLARVFLMIEDREYNIRESTLETKTNDEIKTLVQEFLEKNNNFRLRLRLIEYDKEISSRYHELNILQKMPDSHVDISSFDKEIYCFERKMGKWNEVFGTDKMELGTFNIISKLYPKKCYEIFNKPIIEEVRNYYKEMFNIENINTESGNNEVNKICKEYIKGLFWTFDFYFNKNNSENNYNLVSTWSYKYKRAPLITQITSYFYSCGKNLRKELENIFTFDINQYVDRKNYFTKNEHYLYTTPMNKILSNIHMGKYKDFIISNNQFYMNIEEFINKVKSNEKINVDSKRINFLNKININELNYVNYNDFVNKLENYNLKEQNLEERKRCFNLSFT